jgi:hypothetical protein
LHYVTRSCIQCNKKAHRRGQERTSRRASAEVFSTAGNPLPTSYNSDVKKVLQMDRRGHAMAGMDSVYVHVTDDMRQHLCDVLEGLWRTAIAERHQIAPRSAVPILDLILLAHAQTSTA